MDYNDNDYQSHLAGEDSSKVSSVLHSYALPKFDFDDSLQGHLRFDSLVENEVFLGIPTQEDNHWIEDFSRGSSGIEFSSSATDSCSIPRRNNVWSEATSTESVEMLLKSVGQEEMVPGNAIIEESDAGNELGCLILPAESSLKLDDKRDDVKDSLLDESVEEKLQTEIKSVDENLGEAKTLRSESLSDNRQPSIPVIQSAINECLTDSLPASMEILASQHKSTDCHGGNTSGLPSEHHKPEVKQISVSKESSMGDEKSRGCAVESETCTSNASPPSLATSKLEVVKELPTETRMTKSEPPCVQRNECSLTTEGCKEDTSSVEAAETVSSKDMKDNLPAEGNSILCEVEEASVSRNCLDMRDTENQEGSSKGQTEKVSAMQMSDGLTTSTEKEEVSEISEPSKQNNGNGIYSLEGPSNIQEASVSAELVERPARENLETGNDAERVSEGNACAGDHVSLSVPAGSMDVCGESFSHVVDVDTTNAGVSVGKEKEEMLPVENEMERSCVRDHGVRSSSVEGESEQISDQGHGSQFESSTLNNKASDVGLDGRNLILGGNSVSVPLLSGSGVIATEIVDHDEKLKPVSVLEGSDHFAGKEEMQVVLSAEAELSTLKESSERAGQLGPLSNDGEDASGDCHMEIKPMVVDQNVFIQDNPDTASHVEQAAIAEANIECCKHVEVCATNSGSIIKEVAGVGAGAEAAPLEKNKEMKLVEVGVKGSSDVIGGLKHDSAAVLSCTALSPSEKKTTKSRSRAVVKNVAPLVDTTDIGGKAQSTSINLVENASTNADRSFTFDVSPLAGNAKGEADKSIAIIQACQATELKAGDKLHLTSGSKQTDSKIMQEISHASPLVSDKGTPSGGAKGDRKARRGSGKSGKENPRKGSQLKEINSSKQSDRGDKSCVQFSPSVAAQKMQFEAGTVERITKSSAVVSFPISNLPDLNTSSPASVLFHQPFTDLQQVQLRAQIFVYGSLIQGTAPEEACMVSAFGPSDGVRSLWDPAWRACVERIHGQRSRAGNNETPSHPRSEMRNAVPRTPDQANKQVVHQNKVTTSAAGRASGKATNSPAVSPMIPLSSPLWNMPTPSRDGFSSARGAVVDYKALSSMHPYQTPPARTFAGHTASWLPQAPFPGPWVASPQNSAFDISAQLPALPVTESVKLTPVKESSSSIAAGAKHALPGSAAHSGDSGILSGASLHDNKKAAVLPAQYSADPKSRKRKKASGTEDRAQKSKLGTSSGSVTAPVICTQSSNKSPASDDFGQLSSVAVAPLVAHSQTGPASVPIIGGHFSTSVVITPPSSSEPINNSDIPITSAPSSTDLSKRALDLGKKTPTLEYLSNVEEAKLQAEDAAANAAAAVGHCQDVWSRLDKHKNSDLALDIEVKLTSAAVAVAAAASVAKAAAAAAKLASNAALQAKLMADEAMIAYDVSNSSQTSAVSFPNIVNNLGSATPASILKSQDVGNGSSSIIFAAREASRRRIEAASAASRHAENLDAIVKAAELADEAVSHAGKVVTLADPLPLTQLVEAGPDSYWKVSQTLSGQGVKVNEDESGIPIVEKTPGIFSKRSEGPSVEEMHPTIPDHQPTSVSENIIGDNMRNKEVIQTPVTVVEKDVRGAKGHSLPEVSKTVGLVAESSHDLVEACGDVASSRMQEGSLVEVFKDSDDGKRAWYSAKVLTLKNEKALVCYTDHQSDEGLEQLKDWVPLDAGSDEPPRIRPPHPVTALQGEKKRRRAAVKEYTWYVGDRVDAWIDYRWREGVIAEKNKRDETTFSVNFPAYGDTAVVRAWHLRPSLVWKDGEWVEWSRSRRDFLSQGDTPKEKRVKLGNRAIEDTGNDGLSKKMDPLVPVTNEPATLLPLSVNEKTFNIGSTKDDNKPNTLRTMRSGLQKEGSKVFGVPKPGKKRKFMEVSKHYVSDRATKSNAAHGSAKFTKYLMPQATGTGGWKTNSRTDLKEKQAIDGRRKLPKPSKPPSSARNLKDNSVTSTGDASGADHMVGDAIEYDKHEAQQPNVVNFVSNAEEGAEGPMKFRSEALPTNIPKKASTSSNRGEGMKKKIPVSSLKSRKVEVKDKMIPEVNEPRRSNRRIQPTSRLLEGLQSSLIISKLPSVSHDKSSRSHSRGASR